MKMKLFKKENKDYQELLKENNSLKLYVEILEDEKKDNIFEEFKEYQKLKEQNEIQKQEIKKLKAKLKKFKEEKNEKMS